MKITARIFSVNLLWSVCVFLYVYNTTDPIRLVDRKREKKTKACALKLSNLPWIHQDRRIVAVTIYLVRYGFWVFLNKLLKYSFIWLQIVSQAVCFSLPHCASYYCVFSAYREVLWENGRTQVSTVLFIKWLVFERTKISGKRYKRIYAKFAVHAFLSFISGPPINSMINDGEEPLPSLSDWHDYEPNLEFDDTELTHPATTNGKYAIIIMFLSHLGCLLFLFVSFFVVFSLNHEMAFARLFLHTRLCFTFITLTFWRFYEIRACVCMNVFPLCILL